VEKPPKDAWDKVSAVSSLVSGLTVALIGFYATNVYTRRQRLTEEHRKGQELVISQIQTVEKFIPHLSSRDENAKAGALIAISALGNEELAIKLAAAYGGPGATAALTSIVSTGGSQGAASAERALKEIFQHLQARVVRLTNEKGGSASGLVFAERGWIVTPSYVADHMSYVPVSARLGNGQKVSTELLKRDENLGLAMLGMAAGRKAEPIDLVESDVGIGERVISLLSGSQGERLIEIGSVIGVIEENDRGKGKVLISLRGVGPESLGSPVVDSKGNFVGLIFDYPDSPDRAVLVPARDVISFLASAIEDLAVRNRAGEAGSACGQVARTSA
jgi:Trypsin-like peptidase domain